MERFSPPNCFFEKGTKIHKIRTKKNTVNKKRTRIKFSIYLLITHIQDPNQDWQQIVSGVLDRVISFKMKRIKI